MKIALCITKSNWGGAQKYVFDLATSFSSRGHDVVVIAGGAQTDPNDKTQVEGELIQKLKQRNIRTITLKNSQRDFSFVKELLLMFELNKIFKTEKFEVVHINSSKMGIGALVATFRNVFRIVFTAHGWAFNEPRPWWQKNIIKFVSWLTILFCDRVICLSRIEYNQVIAWPFCKKKLVIIPLGIIPPEYLDRDTARNSLGITEFVSNSPTNVLGTIAELHPNKGLAFMIETMQQLPNYKWIVIGQGELKEKFMFELQSRGLQERIKFLGAIPDASQYIKAFDVFVLPSVKEGLPYTILEAGFAQVPVISTTVGGIPELVNKSAIVVPPANSQALEQAIRSLDSMEKRVELSGMLIEHLKNSAHLKMMVDSTTSVYQ